MNGTSGFRRSGGFYLPIINKSVHARATASIRNRLLTPFSCQQHAEAPDKGRKAKKQNGKPKTPVEIGARRTVCLTSMSAVSS